MHALRTYIEAQMDRRTWSAADLVRASGISKQVISGLLNDDRPSLDRLPTDRTVSGLASAFSVDRVVILAKIGEAMGLPLNAPVVIYDASRVPNDELIRELASRLREDGEHGGNTAATRPARDDLADTAAAPSSAVEKAFDLILEAGDGRQLVFEMKNPTSSTWRNAVFHVPDQLVTVFDSIAQATQEGDDVRVAQGFAQLESYANSSEAGSALKVRGEGSPERFVTRTSRRPDREPPTPTTPQLPVERSAADRT